MMPISVSPLDNFLYSIVLFQQVDRLNAEIVSLNEKLTESSSKVSELQSLQDKQDGLLENLFNGDYGSELEDKLEAEHEELRSKRDQLVLVAMKWRSCKDALSKACSQLAYSVARWHQIKEYPNIPNIVSYPFEILCWCAVLLEHSNSMILLTIDDNLTSLEWCVCFSN